MKGFSKRARFGMVGLLAVLGLGMASGAWAQAQTASSSRGGTVTITPSGSTSLGDVSVGTSKSVTLTVANRTNASVSILASAPSPWSKSGTCGASLAREKTCTVVLTFMPTSAPLSSTATVNAGSATATVSANAVVGTPKLAVTPPTLFIECGKESSPASRAVNVRNVGTGYLKVTGANIAAPFSVGSISACSALAAQQSCSVAVTYRPSSQSSQTLTITALNGDVATVRVSGQCKKYVSP